MKNLNIKKVKTAYDAPWREVLKSLNVAPWNAIDTINWMQFSYRPKVEFRMVYSDFAFLLHYKVKEQAVRAIATADNGEVWKDSCVEFFFAPANDGIYYNFEFNCIGTCLLAAGLSSRGREYAPSSLISTIRRQPSIGLRPFNEHKRETKWELALVIPYTCLFKHHGLSLAGKTASANFYKCGSGLTVPHYLSWNPIRTNRPDFHRPDFFGSVRFA